MQPFTTALVVAAEPTLEAKLTTLLGNRGIATTCVSTPADGLASWTQQQQPLVFLATIADSSDLIRVLRIQSPASYITVMGEATFAVVLAALRAGVNDYLPLPFGQAEFMSVLDKYLEHTVPEDAILNEVFVEQVQIQSLALMSRLAANLAHEINNPLTPILGLAEILRDEAGPGTPTAALSEAIITSARRIAATTQSLMGFTRPLARRDAVDLRHLINETLQSMTLTLAEQHIHIQLELSSTPVSLVASVAELKQALFILIDHARQSMPDGGTLSIRLAVQPDADGITQAKLAISNTAVPIADYHLPHVFAPFYSPGRLNAGIGPGLAMARQIVVVHGGRVGIEAGATVGNTIHVMLPVN